MLWRGMNQEAGRPYNRRIVLETLRLHGRLTRTEIARHIGLTVQTVSSITTDLLEEGILASRRGAGGRRGFPAPTLEIDPEGGFSFGIHLTPRGIDGALINLSGELVARLSADTPSSAPDATFAEIARLTRELGAVRPDGRMLGVGLAMPGPFGSGAMSFVGPTTMEGWQDVPIRRRLTAATGLPAFVETDTVAAAHGELLHGDGSRFGNFYYLYFGVGLGGCAVQDGRVLRGARGNAGEIGHLPVVPGGDPCPCGNRGCLERYVSLDARDRRSAGIGEEDWLAEIAPIMRTAVVTIENLFDPETIIMGGIAPAPLLEKLRALGETAPGSVALRSDRAAPRLITSRDGADAALHGAAALVLSNALSPRAGLLSSGDGASETVESDGESWRIA